MRYGIVDNRNKISLKLPTHSIPIRMTTENKVMYKYKPYQATMSTSPSSKKHDDGTSIPSDTFSIRDLLSWNPFYRKQVFSGTSKNPRRNNSDENNVDNDDLNVTYDNHWILIFNGSYKGYFDWIPLHLRIGKWSIMAVLYFRTLWFLTIALMIREMFYNTNHDGDGTTTIDDAENICLLSSNENNVLPEKQQYCNSRVSHFSFSHFLHSIVQRYWTHNANTILQMSPVVMLSSSFYYNTIVAVYMAYICYSIIAHSPLSYGAWITYTVQSWTLLFIRHVLYSLSALFDSTTNTAQQGITAVTNNNFIVLAELLRFPCAVAHTMTFVVWNFILVPYILCVALRNDAKKRHDFIRFCTNFRLFNLHGMNILFCVANVWYFNGNTNPLTTSRTLEMADLYLSGISAFMYFTFYLCILDRLGIHLYPIFSPRHSNVVVFIVWTSVILLYIATFHLWQYIIMT